MLAQERMPGAVWCPGESLNYAEHLLRRAEHADRPALLYIGEDEEPAAVSWARLRGEAGALAARLRAAGVQPGDRVGAYLANTPEAVIGLIACASIGAVWSVCAPDFGTGGVASRFAQLRPKVLIATTGYRFGGNGYDRREAVEELIRALPTLERVIWLDGLQRGEAPATTGPVVETWDDAVASPAALHFMPVPFDHPLWVLFSSGTTGTPKGIVQGHGGILLEHLKTLGIQSDVRPGDRYMLLGSTSWMVWDVLVSSLLVGATAVLVDGNPIRPDIGRVWEIAEQVGATTIGVGAGLLHACDKARLRPRERFDLSQLRSVLSTGSPLSPAGFRWVHDALGPDVWLNSQSGGTDVCSAFVGGCPLLPVRTGRIQHPCIGAAVEAWDAEGHALVGAVGELVLTRPMPSMPLSFWGDEDQSRYRDSYFNVYPGVWRHGDFIEIDADGSSVIHGRSDSTLNRNGVRMGSADIYQAVEALPDVVEALVLGVEIEDGDYYMPLFVELAAGADADAARAEIVAAIRRALSPRHVPDEVVVAPGVPHTKTGKKLEVPIKRLLQGAPRDDVADPDAIDRPDLLDFYAGFATSRSART
jgi:acetoacetyl-CoA synthetase